MKVKGPQSPLSSGGAESLDPRDLRKAVKGGSFAEALSNLEAGDSTPATTQATGASGVTASALEQIARGADLTSEEDARRAVRESARLLIHSTLGHGHRETEQAADLIENLSEYVAEDPFLKSKLLNILKKLKAV
jgi:hypothetical protein